MMDDPCTEMSMLIQADEDGELGSAEAARVAAHIARCPACTKTQESLRALSGRLRQDMPYHRASADLRASVRAKLAEASRTSAPAPRPAGTVRRSAAPFGIGFALAASLALAFVLPSGGGLPDSVVAGHIRALQPGHLTDVISTDQHTVKPWFDGRLDFAPPVKDLKAEGFPLTGGRLDYLAGRPVAALVYQRGGHIIDLFVWPDDGHFDRVATEGSRSGYNFQRWTQDGMAFWAVSDLEAADLANFVRLWQTK